jgi:hypothetical protein
MSLAACASHPPPALAPAPASAPVATPAPPPAPTVSTPKLPHYVCGQDAAFDVRFGDGSAELLFASGESETLMRDAGGTSPQQAVFSSTRMKVEFGLDPDGRGAQLNVAQPPVSTRCMRD